MSVAVKELRNGSTKWNEAFESKGLKVYFGKTKAMVSGCIKKMAYLKAKITHVWLQLERKG